jgi:hypothetical protein
VTPTRLSTLLVLFLSVVSASIAAQNAQPTAVPTLVRFSGNLKDANGKPLSGIAGLTFALYQDSTGGAPIWLETQNVQVDTNGHYTVQLGAAKPGGLPIDIFTTGEARWLGVQLDGQPEQPRVLLLAVPYALKAADAETVGGLPPSAFVRTPSENSTTADRPSGQTASVVSSTEARPQANQTVTTPGGTANFVPLWTGATTIGSSALYQSGNNVGIGTVTPAYPLQIGNIGSAGFTFDAALQTIGTTYGSGGNFTLTVTDAGNGNNSGATIFLGGPARGDAGSNAITFSESGTEYMRIDGNAPGHAQGNIGIGTATPSVKAEIANGGNPYNLYLSGFAPSLYLGGASGIFPNGGTGQTSAGYMAFATTAGAYNVSAGDLILATQSWQAGNSNAIRFLTPINDSGQYGPVMSILRSGNVGLGTTNPLARLDVVGSVKVEGSGNGIAFPDGTIQTTAAGVATIAACSSNQKSPPSCGCSHIIQSVPISNGSSCQVTASTGSCSAVSTGGINGETFGMCCVCSPN